MTADGEERQWRVIGGKYKQSHIISAYQNIIIEPITNILTKGNNGQRIVQNEMEVCEQSNINSFFESKIFIQRMSAETVVWHRLLHASNFLDCLTD